MNGMTAVSSCNNPPTTAPFAEKDWVAEGDQHPEIARVKDVYWDDIANEWVMDLVLYSPDGDRIGRKSPRMGGPGGFEPAVPCKYWRKIQRPYFPLSRDTTGFRDWKTSLDYIEPEGGATPA